MQYTRRTFGASTICSSQTTAEFRPRFLEAPRGRARHYLLAHEPFVKLGGVKHDSVKRVVSVSLGASGRDFCERLTLLGQEVVVERRGVDGDLKRAAALIRELDGHVAAIGLGGIDLYLGVGKTRYVLRDAARLAAQATRTPVLDGGGLKAGLEKRVVERLHAEVGLGDKRVFMVSTVDRFGMAQALAETGAQMHYGDLVSILDMPLPMRSLTTVRGLARVILPVARYAPISCLYPTGAAQEQSEPTGRYHRRYTRLYAWAEVLAGDWHLIRRYLPERLDGKTVLTNTTTAANVSLLRERGAARLVTTTPRLGGRSIPTNVLEAAFVAVTGGELLSPSALAGYVAQSGLNGTFLEF